ncbi:MAG: AAA family ATPase, partial [Thiogranum sp.]
MPATPAWHTRPVFITSTFRDMHAERDYLRTHVFPELEERLRARRTHLEPVDLRWGVETVTREEEHEKEMLVLKVCLAEVERSRPFLIGLIGDRYGWIPPEDRMAAAAREAGFGQPVAGRSVTDLEIHFGVLDSPEQRRRSLFYFRDPLPYDDMPPQLAAEYSDAHNPDTREGVDKLAALKARLESGLPGRVRRYRARWDAQAREVTGLEAWGRQVLEDLWRELEAETAAWARQAEPTWQETERWTLDAFLEGRRRNFTGREPLLGDLKRHALSLSPQGDDPAWGVCVTGPAGAGKSALLAELNRRLQDEDVLLLTHAAGISLRAGQVDAMLRRWTGELAAALEIADPLGDAADAEEVEKTFHRLLGRASEGRRVVLLIDALDQFERATRATHLAWLPKLWPPNARLIATAIPGRESGALARRSGARLRTLDPLSRNEAADIAAAVCRRYRRTLHADVLRALLDKARDDGQPAAGNALWLELAVEELNLLDADDFARAEQEFAGTPEQRLHQLLVATAKALPAGIEDLYGWLLERSEQLFGKAWARAFVNLIAVSRHGWRERELRVLMPALFVLLLVLLVDALFQPGFGRAFGFLFRPDASHLSAAGILEALGHSFFTLSLGMGAMITYGS